MNYRETTFTVTGQHLELLRRMYVDWDETEFGAPCIDPKRPYGNSDVLGDIAEILYPEEYGAVYESDAARELFMEDNREGFYRLHQETQVVLQILVTNGSVLPGLYERSERWSNDWRRIGDA